MRIEHDPPEALLDLIYDAAADSRLWPSIFREVAGLTNSAAGVLLFQSDTTHTIYFEHNYGGDAAAVRALKERHVLNPWTHYMWSNNPVGRAIPSDQILPLADLRRTAFYDEVLRPQGLGHSAMIGLSLTPNPGLGAGLSMNRGPRQGPYDNRELRLIEALFPHLRRSVRLGFRIEAYQALRNGEYRTLDRLAVGIVLLDRQARIVYSNAAARALDGEDKPLRLGGGRVAHSSPSHTRRLDHLVQATLHHVPMTAIGVPCPDDGRVVTVLASSVRGEDLGRFADAHMKDAAVILFISDPVAKMAVPASWLMDTYRMTPAEADVAVATASYGGAFHAAQRLNLSPNTVKSHLARVFAKTGVSGQGKLSELIASLGVALSA